MNRQLAGAIPDIQTNLKFNIMATPNFSSPENASGYYAIFMSYQRPVLDDDGNETDEMETVHPDDWEIQEGINDLKINLKELEGVNYSDYSNFQDHSRSYNNTALGDITASKDYAGITFEVIITPILTSAYYEGATLDYLVKFGNDWDSNFDDIFEVVEDGFYRSDLNKGMQEIQKKHATNWLEKTVEEIGNIVDEFLKSQAEYHLVKTAQFSNGEAIYEKADNRRAQLKSALLES